MKQLTQNVTLTQTVATLDAECNKFFNANCSKAKYNNSGLNI